MAKKKCCSRKCDTDDEYLTEEDPLLSSTIVDMSQQDKNKLEFLQDFMM